MTNFFETIDLPQAQLIEDSFGSSKEEFPKYLDLFYWIKTIASLLLD